MKPPNGVCRTTFLKSPREMISIPQDKLRSLFLSRLKTQERAYNDLGLYYTPRLFTKLVKDKRDLKERLNGVYHSLIDKIEIEIDLGLIYFSDIDALIIEENYVFAVLSSDRSNKHQLRNLRLRISEKKHLTIDHNLPFYELIKENLNNLLKMRTLTDEIRQGRNLTKEQMRKEYQRIFLTYSRADIDSLIQEIESLAQSTTLRLMASDKNYAKGRIPVSINAPLPQAFPAQP